MISYHISMLKRPCRVEVNYPKRGKPKYYLVRDVKVRSKKSKARKYIRSGVPLTSEEVEIIRKEFAYEMELKVAQKKAELSSSFYISDYLSPKEIGFLEEIRYMYLALKDLLTTNELEVYEKNFEVKYIHGTTFIEGNTISLAEASDLLLRGIQPKDKRLREINEIQNFKNVVSYRNKYRGKVTLDFIKHLHALIMYNIDDDSAGSFRRSDDIAIHGCDFRVCPAELIEPQLKDLIMRYYNRIDLNYHPFEEAVLFHHQFEVTHPFTNGNGRVGREIFNYMIMREKYPRLLFLGDNRDIYLDALKNGDQNDYANMVSILASIIREQRFEVLRENLRKTSAPIQKTGQVRLTDFL